MNYFETQIPEPPAPPAEKPTRFRGAGGIVITIYALMAVAIVTFSNTPAYGDIIQKLALPMFIVGCVTALVIFEYGTKSAEKKQPWAIRALSILAGSAIAAAVFFGGVLLAFAALVSNVHEGSGC